ncbi:MAG: glycosyltransferase, partial [Pseudonocardiaceae bacterium]
SRRYSRSVNIGGNGQLTRLSALVQIAGDEGGPWRGSLLEDFELGLHLLIAGWRNAFTADAWVDQEALWQLRRFLTQRVRWAQGPMQCLRYLPKVWMSPHVTNLGALEMTYFLLQPWLQVIGSIVYPVPMLVMAYNAANYPDFFLGYLAHGGWLLFAIYLAIGVSEFGIWPLLYRRACEPAVQRRQALSWALLFTAYQGLVPVVAWRALTRTVLKRSGWAKTRRNAETVSASAPVALES